jgi:peptidoglycan/LPS O-acetylase OafA/YrhL
MATVRGLAIAAVISIIACLSILYVKYYIHYNIPLLLYAGLFPTWLVFFVEGLYLKNNSIKINVKKMALFFVFVGILLSIAETYYWYGKYRDFGNSITAVKLSSFFFSFFLVLYLLSSSKNQINSKILVFLGNASFGIYLMHMLFLPIVESCLNKIFPKIASIQLVYQPLSISLTIFLCLFTRYAAKKLNSNFSSKYLGL